jgi:Cytidylate kinase-like family
MNAINPSVFAAEALLRASEHPRPPHPGEAAAAPFTIAVSRDAGALGASVAREVGRRLNWPVYDRELLEHIAQDLRVSVRQVEDVDERPGHWLQEWAEAFTGAATVPEPAYFWRLLQLLRSLGHRGECVIVGRGAAQLLPAATTLRVRLVAAREDRVAAVGRELGLSPHEAARYVDTTDRERIQFVRSHFRKDPADPENYDLVFNSSRFTAAEAAELVIEALCRLQARPAGKEVGV